MFIYSMFLDQNNKPVKRNKQDYPYSYDFHIVHRLLTNKENSHTFYDDRLRSKYSNWDTLYDKYFNGINFTLACPYKIEDFLKELLCSSNIKLIYVMEGCNVSNGYPVWAFSVLL